MTLVRTARAKLAAWIAGSSPGEDPPAGGAAGAAKSGDPDPKSKPEAESEPDPTSVAGLVAALATIRSDLATFGTGVGLVSSGLTTAAVLATLESVFPLPASHHRLLFSVVAALLFMAALGSAALTRRYFAARRRIVIETSVIDPYAKRDIRNAGFTTRYRVLSSPRSFHEIVFLERPLKAIAAAESAANIRSLDARIARLERVAARAEGLPNEPLAKLARGEAARLHNEIELATLQGATSLLEFRSAAVYKGNLTVVLAMVVAVGVAGLFVVADWSKGERDRVPAFLTCQKDAAATGTALTVCSELDPRRSSPAPAPSASADASPTPAPSSPEPGAVVSRLSSCATITDDPTAVPRRLREAALASCAGLPLPVTSPNPSPTS